MAIERASEGGDGDLGGHIPRRMLHLGGKTLPKMMKKKKFLTAPSRSLMLEMC